MGMRLLLTVTMLCFLNFLNAQNEVSKPEVIEIDGKVFLKQVTTQTIEADEKQLEQRIREIEKQELALLSEKIELRALQVKIEKKKKEIESKSKEKKE